MYIGIILWIWLGTFVISFSTDIKNNLNIYKKAADEGLKINFDNLDNLSVLLDNSDTQKIIVLEWFIPFYNLKKSKKNQNELINKTETIIRQLKITGVLEEMTEDEIIEYQKNPSLSNMLNISLKPKRIKYDAETELINKIESKIRLEQERQKTRINNIEELKKLREEITELSKSDCVPVQKLSKIFLNDLDEIEKSYGNLVEETPNDTKEDKSHSLKKKL